MAKPTIESLKRKVQKLQEHVKVLEYRLANANKINNDLQRQYEQLYKAKINAFVDAGVFGDQFSHLYKAIKSTQSYFDSVLQQVDGECFSKATEEVK